MKKALALDVGGTKIYNAIINENGEIISEIEKHSTPKTYEEIKQVFREIIKKHEKDVDKVTIDEYNETIDKEMLIVDRLPKKSSSCT